MGTYCTDEDMTAIRANIMDLGVTDWLIEREQAYEDINKLIIVRWWRQAAISMGLTPNVYPSMAVRNSVIPTGATGTAFDPTRLDTAQIKRCAVFKSLELAYMKLMKEGENADGFERLMDKFALEFTKAFDLEIAIGLLYDWDDDGETSDEAYVKTSRRLYRS